MLELCEAEMQRPYEMRQEGSHVAQDADRYYGDDNDCYTPVALIGGASSTCRHHRENGHMSMNYVIITEIERFSRNVSKAAGW